MRGEALWDEELSLVCTMFVNPKTGTYEPKPAVFVVKEILEPPLKERVYAEATIDLLEFAMQPGRTVKRTLPLAQGKKTLPTHLIFSIKATPLKEGVAISEVSSDMSVADLAEVAEASSAVDAGDDAEDDDANVRDEAAAVTLFEQHRRREQQATNVDDVAPETWEEAEKPLEEEIEEMNTQERTRVTMEEGMRALQASLEPDPEEIIPRAPPPRANPPQVQPQPPPQSGRYLPPALSRAARYDFFDDERDDYAGYTVGVNRAGEQMLEVGAGRGFDGVVSGLDRMRLIVGKTCKINIRAADMFGNARSSGGDNVEGILTGPDDVEGTVIVVDYGDGTYGLEFACTSQGVWTLQLRFNGRLSSVSHTLIVSYGPLVAADLVVRAPKGPFSCGGYSDVVVEIARPELGRVMSGAEAFSIRVISPSAMSMSVPLELEPGAIRAVATVCWPEVGEHSISVTLDGALVPRCPISVVVAPEDICLAACQIQGSGTHRANAGERASFVVEAHDARGNRLTVGGAPLSVVVRAMGGPSGGTVTQGQVLDYGNGAYEASYVIRSAGPYEVALVLAGEELVMKGNCEPGKAVVTGCELMGDAVLDLEVGTKGRFTIERHDAYGNRTPSRQGQVAIRCSVDGPGPVDVHVVDGAGGRSDIVASATVAGRYFLTCVGGDNQDPVPGSPFELVAYPGAASPGSSVTSVYGAQLASPDSDVLTAVAGDEITLTVTPRDAFGNPTVFGPGAGVTVTAVGGNGSVERRFEDRGGPRAEATLNGSLNAAGSYLLSAKVGDEALMGYPRILQIVPGATDPRRCVLFGEALGGVDCGRTSSLTMHAADRFGNLRATGGDVVDLSMLAPDGKTVIAATVVDHADGTYGATFKLDQAGQWGLQLIVNGRGGRTDVSEVTANFGPCKAADCIFTGFGMDGLEGVTTLSTSRIVVQPAAYESANRHMSGKESLSVRVLSPSGGISAVELKFSRGTYVGSYRWTQPGLHTVSVSLDQEAVVGSPFTVEALAALPEIRELENMSAGDVNGILVKLTPEAASQALAALPAEQAAESLNGHSADSIARMMNGMYPNAVSQVLTALPGNAAAAAVSAMSEDKTREILAAMPAQDTGKLMASMSADDINAKAGVLAETLAGMRSEEAAEVLAAMVASASSSDGVAAVLNHLPAKQVAAVIETMSPEDATKMLAGMSHDEAAAAIEAMSPANQAAMLQEIGDGAVLNLTRGLGAAYKDDRRLPAAERQKQRDAAAMRARQLAPSLAQMPPAKLAQSMKDADAGHLAGTLHALVHEPTAVRTGKPGSDAGSAVSARSAAASLLRELPMDKQRAAVPELLANCPPGTAGAILGDFSGEEVAKLLAAGPTEQTAKTLVELVRELPARAAALSVALPASDAAAALSLIIASVNRDDGVFALRDAELAALLEGAPGDVLKLVEPATALGTACATHLSPSSAAAVLGTLDAASASRALEGMSGEEVRQVLEASAQLQAAEGKAASDTPLVAAMVPYMASLDGAGAAAMIEALPPDMAVGVMMNTPDSRAQEVLQHTKNRALKERVANRATMAVDACDVVFEPYVNAREGYAGVAGETLRFKVVAREQGGTRIMHGGAHLSASSHASNATSGFGEPCAVSDLGGGEYEVSYVAKSAGKTYVRLESGNQSRDVEVLVEAGEPMVSSTEIDRSGMEGWKAGEPGVLKLKLRDRFGNPVPAARALFTFEARASGPGGVAVEQRESPDDGGVQFDFRTTVAGIYKVTVACVDTKETIPGLPIDVIMGPDKISHVGCTASLQTLTGATKGPGAAAAAFGVTVAMAGEEITALVDARDRFGNATMWSGESVTVVAHGPAHAPADRAFDVVDVRGGRAALRGLLPRAGSYTLAVSVDDIPAGCSPLVLHVHPGLCETSRATIRGDALSGVLRGAPAHVTVQTEDKFGNNCHGGSDQVDLVLQGPTGARASAVDVVDHGDGTYGCTFVAPMAGRWIVQAVVNGRVAKESTVEVIATYGPLQATDCVLRPGPGMGERTTCGTSRDVYLQALEYDSTGRGMSGQEAVSMHLITPSGASHTLSASFAERGCRYRAPVRWWEVGRHEIVATINGEPVVGSPLVLEVDAQEVSLPMCRLSGPGLTSAVAGERATILVEARDARGNRLFQGGAVIGVAVRVGGETQRGRVHDCGDGTYEASYVVERAGPFEVSLFLGTEATTFRATCAAGRVDYTQCRVEGALHSRWVAGKPLALVVTRMDRYGNRVPRREGLAPLHGRGTGPGEVTCELLELGNGSCELRYSAVVAGVYSLGVFVDEEPTAPPATEERAEALTGAEAVGAANGGGSRANGSANGSVNGHTNGHANGHAKAASITDGPVDVAKTVGAAPVKVGDGIFSKSMFPLPGGQFELTLDPGPAEPTKTDIAVVGASMQGETWVVAAGVEIMVKVIARDRHGNKTHWAEGRNVAVEARGPEYVAFSVTGATGVQADYLARMVRAGTFELRVNVDSLAVCWRALQVVAGPTCAPRCKISMEGLKGLHTGDTCRLTLKAADQYGNLRLDGNDAIQLTLEGPGGAFARAVQVTDHADGTYALEFVTPLAGRWTLSTRVNGTSCVEGGIAFSVAFGTLTAEEAVIRLVPSLEESKGLYECGTTSDLIIAGAGFQDNGRLMTGLEAVTVRLLQPSGTQEALPCVLSKDMTHYCSPIRWLHPGDHAISVLLDGVQVAGTPIRVRAEGMEVALSTSVFTGSVERCVAGEKATIRLEAKDYGGNPIHRGGAPLMLEARVPGEDPVPGELHDIGNGTYEFEYVVEKAGPLEVAIILAKESPTVRTLPVLCVAGPMEPSECRIDAGKLMLQWRAGDPGVVRVTRKDKFGNPTRDPGPLNRLAAEVVGPGPCDCEAVELGDGTCELRLRASAAGSYDVSIVATAVPGLGFGASQQEVGHFAAEVSPGPTFPSACVARMALLTADGAGAQVEESLGEPDSDITLPATVMAGDRVLVYVLPRDCSGNKARWTGGERIAVAARGPAEIPFEPLDTVGAFAATLSSAGAYSVAALVGDCSCAGWPRLLQVVAGSCDPDRCTISGDALGHCATGTPLKLQLQATDKYGNPRSMGGDLVEVSAKPRNGGGRVEAAVVDNGDGTYALTFVLEEAAPHDLFCNVNGLPEAGSRHFLAPALAPLSAPDCVVRGISATPPSVCDVSTVFIQPGNPIRQMSGREAVTVTVHTPSGLALNSPCKFEQSMSRFASPVYWVESGAHSVSVTLNGAPLPGCPFLVRVRDPLGEEMSEMARQAHGEPGEPEGERTIGGPPRDGTAAGGMTETTIVEEVTDPVTGEVKTVERVIQTKGEAAPANDVAGGGAGGASEEDEPKRFEFGGAGLRPSKTASERAARSLSSMAPKVAAQALVDMRPAASGAVLASMDPETAGAAVAAMEPAVAASSVCAMDVDDAKAVLAASPKETRRAVIEAMAPDALGALLSAMSPEEASDALRDDMDAKTSNAALEHTEPAAAAAAMQLLPEAFLVETLEGVNPRRGGAPMLEALCESGPAGARLATLAVTALSQAHLERAAAHVAAMIEVGSAAAQQGIPGTGHAVAGLFCTLPRDVQGSTFAKLSSPRAAFLLANLGPQQAARAIAAVAADQGGGGGAASYATAAAAMETMHDDGGWAEDAAGAPRGPKKKGGAVSDLLTAMVEDGMEDAASGLMGALDPALSAMAVGRLSPSVAARLASGVTDPTVTAAILEEMPAEKRAAMLVKMDPAAGAAASNAMNPELCAEAMETIAHTISTTTNAGANAELQKRLTAMVSQMEPFAAGQAASVMDEELARSMQAALPPDASAAMIASGGIDSKRAAALLDSLPVDEADKVMAALPPNVAEKTAAHVSSGEVKARAAARAVVHLASSTISGKNRESCVAGELATFTLESANPGGGRIARGGAHVVCTVSPSSSSGDERGRRRAKSSEKAKTVEATVEDLQNGVYEVSFTLTAAGVHAVSLTTAGQERTFELMCHPAALDPASCVVEPPDVSSAPWVAGEMLEVKVSCRDRFGNPVIPPAPDEQSAGLVIVADGEGPGMVEADVGPASLEGASYSVARFRGTVVGEYELRVFASERERQWWGGMQRDCLPGAPLTLELLPAAADHQRCTIAFDGLKERPGGMIVGMAGREAVLVVSARDRFNNPAAFDGHAKTRVRIDAAGPAEVAFESAGASPNELRFAAALVKSGSYTLRASVGGRSIAGFPRNLQIVATQTDPTRCHVRGDALNGVTVGDVTRASLTAHDRFGNACLEGGDQVMVRLLGPAGSVDADVFDYGDGTYGLTFAVPRPGEWRAHLAVNGDENPTPVAKFTASQGRLTANQVTLKLAGTHGGGEEAWGGGGSSGSSPHVGAESTVYIQALDYEVAGREVGGREPICLRLLSPSGVSANVPLRLSKDRARFRAKVRWPEVGPHVLVASLNGDAVVNSPLQVSVVAADVHLPVCKVTGGGSSRCRAGERTQFMVEARDARGNRLLSGGASLTLQVQAPGQEPMRGSVLDQGDGTYTASYAVDQAGPYLLVLASQSSRLALEGTCEPAQTDVTKCRVDAAGITQLVAGTPGTMRIIRADRFGNVVPAGPDMLPFRVEASGVGPAEVETVEAGDGACEVRFEARVAGRYTLHVWSGYKRDAVAGSPFDVVVLPGQAASSSCVAHLEGTQLHGPGVTAAVAGEPLVVRMQARDRFGNPTAWKRWQTLSVAASGPQEVIFREVTRETPAGSDRPAGHSRQPRGEFVATLHRAGSYVVWCTVGGQAVVGWPRVIQVVPGSVEGDASVWRPEAVTMAITSELALAGDARAATAAALGRPVRGNGGDVATLQAEAAALRARLAKYEEAAAVVMEAAEASGVTLKAAARAAAYRTSASGGPSGGSGAGGSGTGRGGNRDRL